jgi:hypothetical protein
MTAIVIVLILLFIYGWLESNRKNPTIKEFKEQKRAELKVDRSNYMTYEQLASKRYDLTTARRLIRQGLVKEGFDTDEVYFKAIYDGDDISMSYRAKAIGQTFGLIPGSPNFVGYGSNGKPPHATQPKTRISG